MSPQRHPLTLLLLLLPWLLAAQPDRKQRFAAAAHLGLNLAQIDGDYYFGYNRPGVRFGLETLYLINPKYFLTVGFTYSQGGARPTRGERLERNNATVDLRLNTIEVPVLFNYRLGKKSATGKKDDYALFRSTTLRAGVALSRLASYRTGSQGVPERNPIRYNFTRVEEEFCQFDMYAIVGADIRMGLNGALFVEHSKSVFGLYQPEVKDGDGVLPLFPYALTIGLKYTLY